MTDRDLLLEFVEWIAPGEVDVDVEDVDAFLASREPLQNLQRLDSLPASVSPPVKEAGKSEGADAIRARIVEAATEAWRGFDYAGGYIPTGPLGRMYAACEELDALLK